VSLVSGAARGTIAGLGTAGYALAMRYLLAAGA
jgi:3-dehydroquinate dehydratase